MIRPPQDTVMPFTEQSHYVTGRPTGLPVFIVWQVRADALLAADYIAGRGLAPAESVYEEREIRTERVDIIHSRSGGPRDNKQQLSTLSTGFSTTAGKKPVDKSGRNRRDKKISTVLQKTVEDFCVYITEYFYPNKSFADSTRSSLVSPRR